jgi:hypothetical protein
MTTRLTWCPGCARLGELQIDDDKAALVVKIAPATID